MDVKKKHEKKIMSFILANKISNAKINVEMDVNKPFAVNLSILAKQSPAMQREFFSPKDREGLAALMSDIELIKSMEISVSAVIDENVKELDPLKIVSDAWKEVSNGIPLEPGQEFKVLINGYFRDDSEVLVPIIEPEPKYESEDSVGNLVKYTAIIGALNERVGHLTESNKQLTTEKNTLKGQMRDLQREINKLKKRPTPLKSLGYDLFCLVLGAVIAAAAMAFVFHINPFSTDTKSDDTGQAVITQDAQGKSFEDYEEEIKERDSKISELENNIKELETANSDLVKENEELKEKIKEYESTAPTPETPVDQKTVTGEDTPTSNEPSDDTDFLEMDMSLIQNANENITLVSKDDNSGKHIDYSALKSADEGIVIFSKDYSKQSEFSITVPKGYSRFQFEIGHIMDSGNINMNMKVYIDGVLNDNYTKLLKYDITSEIIEITGLKEFSMIKLSFSRENTGFYGDTQFGMTNMRFYK